MQLERARRAVIGPRSSSFRDASRRGSALDDPFVGAGLLMALGSIGCRFVLPNATVRLQSLADVRNKSLKL